MELPRFADEWTPLVFAAYRGHTEVAKLLCERGTGVTESDGNPIHYAGQRKHREICKLLVAHGAVDDLVEPGDTDLRNLFRAAYSYDPDGVEKILSRRPELAQSRDRHGRAPLHEACTHGDIRTVRALLRFGADMNARDNKGHTPMDRASSHRQHNVVRGAVP